MCNRFFLYTIKVSTDYGPRAYALFIAVKLINIKSTKNKQKLVVINYGHHDKLDEDNRLPTVNSQIL